MIWQDLALFAEMTVAENIAFETMLGNRPRAVSYAASARGWRRRRWRSWTSTSTLTRGWAACPSRSARSWRLPARWSRDARLIFMDEPTASLTQSETDALLAVVRTLSARGVAVVFVSHRLAEVLEISSRVTVLRDGRLVGVYPTEGMTQVAPDRTDDRHLLCARRDGPRHRRPARGAARRKALAARASMPISH